MFKKDTPPCSILIDKEGHWFHKGMEMVRRDFIRFFYRNMEVDAKGRYIIAMAGDRCYVDVEDTPYVIWGIAFENDDQKGAHVSLYLSDDSMEELDPETLSVGDKDVLYCRVRNRAFPARFNRPAYYQLAEYIKEDKEGFFLPVMGRRYPVSPQGKDKNCNYSAR